MHSGPSIFFRRAREEASRYGEDPWVFLRELVQNSRDADATRIDFTVAIDGDWQTLVCRDNGYGMTREVIEEYLLRLYASNKEELASAIGLFGVGFWSVLLFQPAIIRITSGDGRECHALEIDCRGHAVRSVAPPSQPLAGTEIVLRRVAGSSLDARRLHALVEEKLILFAGHIRPGPGGKQLDIYCQGRRLNRPFAPPDVFGRRFRTREFDGVLGFDTVPSVRIYKGGILVRDLTGLEEVIPSRRRIRLPESGWGLYPVIRLNADRIQLLMDRQTIFEDPVLHRAVDYCEKELLRLHRRLIRRLFPMDLANRFTSLWIGMRGKAIAFLAGFFLVLVLGVMGVLLGRPDDLIRSRVDQPPLLGQAPAGETVTSVRLSVDRALTGWRGMFLNVPGERPVRWDFHYEGGGDHLFRLRSFTAYDPQQGLRPVPLAKTGDLPSMSAAGEAMFITIGVTGRGDPFVLPCPPDHTVVVESLRHADQEPVALWRSLAGEAVARTDAPGRLTYAVVPLREAVSVDPFLTGAARLEWPPDWQQFIDETLAASPAERVVRAVRRIRERLVYARDEDLSRRFAQSEGTWLERTIRMGAGDCDVLNGVLVLLLQALGIPARLEAGLVGVEGRAMPALHAWARCYLGEWRTLDVSTGYDSQTSDARFPAERLLGIVGPAAARRAVGQGARDRKSLSATADSTDGAVGPPWAWLLIGGALAAVIGMGMLWWWRRRRPVVDQPQYIRELFRHHLTYGQSGGPLKLQFRPVLPTLGSGCLSLHQVQRLAGRARLLGTDPNCPLAVQLRGRRRMLDASADIVRELVPFLPPVTWLEDWRAVLAEPSLSPAWRQVQAVLDELEPDIRLYRLAGQNGFAEAYLPFRDVGRGRFHLQVGDGHPVWAWAEDEIMANGRQGLFTVLEKLTGMMTIRPARRYRLLAGAARQLLVSEGQEWTVIRPEKGQLP
ncbi:MAG: ATP-binding protein [Acidobacteria bacterium]|nr:ATP-binding protein [Acidobacteriota bacterium]